MKRLLMMLMAIGMVASCGIDTIPQEENTVEDKTSIDIWAGGTGLIPEMEPLTKAEADVCSSNTDFGIEFFKAVVAIYDSTSIGNIVVSPFNTSLLLSALACGVEGHEYEQIVTALHHSGLSAEEINSYYKKAINRLVSPNGFINLALANSIWYDPSNVEFQQDFLRSIKDNYQYSSTPITAMVTETEGVSIINDWTAAATHNMISPLIKGQSTYFDLMVENVLYFNGNWYHHDSYCTEERQFFTIGADIQSRKFFKNKGKELYSTFSNNTFDMISIPYKDESYQMLVLLPKQGISLIDFVSSITPDLWKYWIENMTNYPKMVSFTIPCFDITSGNLNFEKVLKNIGITHRIGQGSSYRKMTNNDIELDVIQRCKVIVNETGSESVSVSMAKTFRDVGAYDSMEFIANRPFVYAIVERTSGAILFMGTHVK